jgi:hypothetical protein
VALIRWLWGSKNNNYDHGLTSDRLFVFVVTGEQKQAQTLLEQASVASLTQNNPEIILSMLQGKSQMTDDSSRKFNYTAFQYALWARDWHMHKMLLEYMPQEEQIKQLQEFISLAKKEEVPTQGPMDWKKWIWFRSFVLYRNQDMQKFISAGQYADSINTPVAHLQRTYLIYVDKFHNWNDKERQEALEQIIKLEQIGTEHGMYHDLYPLKMAYKKYIANYDKWTGLECKIYWQKVIGFFQSRMPRHYINPICHPDRSFDTNTQNTCRFDEAELPRLAQINGKPLFPLSSDTGLGVDLALIRWRTGVAEGGDWCSFAGNAQHSWWPGPENVEVDLHALVEISEIGKHEFIELEKLLLSSSPEPAHSLRC